MPSSTASATSWGVAMSILSFVGGGETGGFEGGVAALPRVLRSARVMLAIFASREPANDWENCQMSGGPPQLFGVGPVMLPGQLVFPSYADGYWGYHQAA